MQGTLGQDFLQEEPSSSHWVQTGPGLQAPGSRPPVLQSSRLQAEPHLPFPEPSEFRQGSPVTLVNSSGSLAELVLHVLLILSSGSSSISSCSSASDFLSHVCPQLLWAPADLSGLCLQATAPCRPQLAAPDAVRTGRPSILNLQVPTSANTSLSVPRRVPVSVGGGSASAAHLSSLFPQRDSKVPPSVKVRPTSSSSCLDSEIRTSELAPPVLVRLRQRSACCESGQITERSLGPAVNPQ